MKTRKRMLRDVIVYAAERELAERREIKAREAMHKELLELNLVGPDVLASDVRYELRSWQEEGGYLVSEGHPNLKIVGRSEELDVIVARSEPGYNPHAMEEIPAKTFVFPWYRTSSEQ